MAIEITTLADLNPDNVQVNLRQLAQMLQEVNPTLDLKRGVLHDLLLYLNAVLATKAQTDLARYLSARSLQQITDNPTLADAEVVGDVLSNWGLLRQDGAAAQGEVVIVLSQGVSVTIGSGAVFTANGRTYTSDSVFTAKREAVQINDTTDRLLTQMADGNWAFTITVTAEDTGTAFTVKKDVLLVPAALPTAYVTSYAASDFTGGLDAETNTELVARLQQGVAARAPSNRVNMTAMLRANAAFNRVLAQSIVGFGDEEMLRDQHAIWPGSLGGKADWYVRTQERVELQTEQLSATLLSVDAEGHGTWQLALDRDTLSAFYEVAYIRLSTADNVLGGFNMTLDERGLDLTGGGFVPDIDTVAEGAYTRYQTAVIRFVDDQTDHAALAVGATQTYDVTVRIMPQIDEIQDYVSGFDIRSYGADVLVRAPVPCFLQLSLVIAKKNTADTPDTATIAEALARAVNNVGFVGRLYASQLYDVIHGYLTGGTSVDSLDMLGRLRRPDGTTHYLRGRDALVVAGAPGALVSERTVQFFLDPADVAITVRNDVPVPE